MALHPDKALGAEARQVSRDHLAHRSEARGQFLVRDGQIEFVGAGLLGSIEQQASQALGHAAERHRFDYPDQVTEAVADHGQNLQCDIGVLTADLLEVALVDEQRDDRFYSPHGRGIGASIEQRELGNRGRSGLQSQHHLPSAGRRLEDLDASFDDQEDAGARLAFPEEHLVGSEAALHRPLPEGLYFGLGQAGEQGDLREGCVFGEQTTMVTRQLDKLRAGCLPVYRRNGRVGNPPQVSNLPHERADSVYWLILDTPAQAPEKDGLVRGFGLLQATALNMSNMVGVGPFITIPLIIAAMGGPQCMLGWVLGAALALCDGLVWSELGAAMPGTGGTYVYLRESFRGTRLGAILPFLFIWQFIFSGPLEIASGYTGFAMYVGYFWRGMGPVETRLVSLGVGVLVMVLLYRRITAVGKLTVALWVGMVATVLWIIAAGLSHFDARVVFDFPPGAFTFSRGFFAGLGSAMLIAMYDFMGYYDICYVGGEVRNPARVIPRSIILSVIAVGGIYALMNLGIIAVVPWREAMQSKFIASQFIEKLYGTRAASLVTVLVLWTAFASVFALLLGYSRIAYAAAVHGHFFKPFARLHPSGQFPHVSLLVMGTLSIVASLWNLDVVISALLTSRILIQFIGQILALHYLRKHRLDIARPFRTWLYPLPSIVAFAGWLYIFLTSGWSYVAFGLLTLILGMVVWRVWSSSARPTSAAPSA